MDDKPKQKSSEPSEYDQLFSNGSVRLNSRPTSNGSERQGNKSAILNQRQFESDEPRRSTRYPLQFRPARQNQYAEKTSCSYFENTESESSANMLHKNNHQERREKQSSILTHRPPSSSRYKSTIFPKRNHASNFSWSANSDACNELLRPKISAKKRLPGGFVPATELAEEQMRWENEISDEAGGRLCRIASSSRGFSDGPSRYGFRKQTNSGAKQEGTKQTLHCESSPASHQFKSHAHFVRRRTHQDIIPASTRRSPEQNVYQSGGKYEIEPKHAQHPSNAAHKSMAPSQRISRNGSTGKMNSLYVSLNASVVNERSSGINSNDTGRELAFIAGEADSTNSLGKQIAIDSISSKR